MSRRRLTLAGAVAAIAATASLLGGVLSESSPTAPAAAARGAELEFSADRALSGFAVGNTAQLVQGLQEQLRGGSRNARSLALLGLAYQQRARETGDPSYYRRAAGVLGRAVRLAPRSELAASGLASLALSQHRFPDALRLSRRAQSIAPAAARNYGLIGDALVELGRYEEAFRAYDRMSTLKPNLASYARVSYGRELLGRQQGAIHVMRLAVQAAGSQSEPAAWTRVQLGKLHFERSEVRRAEREFRGALVAFPGYAYALDGLARVEAARGRYGRAIELARQAAETVPLPEFMTTLGDLYRATGQKAIAREQYAVVAATDRLLRANGVRTDLESALFKIDHGLELRRALIEARAARRARPTIFADDTLAWALVRTGQCEEALRFSKRALRLGTKDASFFFHRGMIERCLGREAQGRAWFTRALDQNPHFSLVWAPVARRALA
jgi:tetratricopeptide (TPR) repeat protein